MLDTVSAPAWPSVTAPLIAPMFTASLTQLPFANVPWRPIRSAPSASARLLTPGTTCACALPAATRPVTSAEAPIARRDFMG